MSSRRKKGNDKATQKFCRRLIALSFLPHEQIPPMFNVLAERANTEPLRNLVAYMTSTWIENEVWPPASWSIFMLPICTNNNLEGWHRRLNTHAYSDQLNLYLLIKLLHDEAEMIQLQATLLSLKMIKRQQRRQQRQMEGRIFQEWALFIFQQW